MNKYNSLKNLIKALGPEEWSSLTYSWRKKLKKNLIGKINRIAIDVGKNISKDSNKQPSDGAKKLDKTASSQVKEFSFC